MNLFELTGELHDYQDQGASETLALTRPAGSFDSHSGGHRRLAFALLLSLLIHALLLSLTFGGEELGLPGFGFPWRDRRIEAPRLNVALVSPQVTPAEPAIPSVAEPLQQAP